MSTLTVGTISEKVTDAGVAVDGVTLKDGGATFTSAVGVTGNTTITSGNLVIGTAGQGIDFSNASGSASGSATALLDDYEEGTWTPTVNSGTISVVSGSARYVKIGNLVTCYARILSFSDTTGSGGFRVESLPFTINTSHTDANIGNAWGNAMGDEPSIFFFSQTNATNTNGYYGATGDASYNQVTFSNFVAETNMIIKLTYITA